MIISEEQVRRAVEYLRTSDEYDAGGVSMPSSMSPELLSRVAEAVIALPDIRDERIEEARVRCGVTLPASEEIASKLIGRLVSDAIR
ncbi:MAG: hypothetical protein U1E08_06785 [Coriobacteriia bacterium]|nr:hypothetical protein [Actinomycetota bacterium]MDZ4167383.1 hypothetical protein [Coriobacteriia bacterium]